MILTRRRLADACLWGSEGLLAMAAVVNVRAGWYGLAGITLALMAGLLIASVIAHHVDQWWAARAGKMQADRDLAAVALKQWESQVQAQREATIAGVRLASRWSGSN